jgi:ribosomal-protein-alanine N-acetyltransferase
MRWWDVDLLLPIEQESFGVTAWSAETFWSELALVQSRLYLVAEDLAAENLRDSESLKDSQDLGGDRDRSLLGYAGLMVSGPEADVQTIAVAGSAQGHGVGGLLLRALVDEAVRRGAGALLLEVRADNAPAIGLYRKHGFVQIAVRRGYYQPGNIDALVMRRRPLRAPDPGKGRPGEG